jgi:hypothetical protein
MSLYSMASINTRRAIREALAWRGYSYFEAGQEIGVPAENVVEGHVPLWKIMALTECTEEQMYEWGHN